MIAIVIVLTFVLGFMLDVGGVTSPCDSAANAG